jgi:putative membrane protein
MTSQEFFNVFTYIENWNIPLNMLFVAIGIFYLLLTGPLAKRIKGAKPVPAWKQIVFILGLGISYFSVGSPLDLMAHELFSMHMLQMSIWYFVIPPLLLLGIPEWMVRPLLKITSLRKIGKFFTKPLIILFVFNLMLSLYHVPMIFDAIMADHALHTIVHTILFLGALCAWWPLTCPIPEYDRMKGMQKFLYLIGHSVLLTPACAMMFLATEPLFAQFKTMSDVFPILSPRLDQQLGGVIMKIIQEAVYIIVLVYLFVNWIRTQREQDRREDEVILQKVQERFQNRQQISAKES